MNISENDLGEKLKAWPSDLNFERSNWGFHNFLETTYLRVLVRIMLEVKSKHVTKT